MIKICATEISKNSILQSFVVEIDRKRIKKGDDARELKIIARLFFNGKLISQFFHNGKGFDRAVHEFSFPTIAREGSYSLLAEYCSDFKPPLKGEIVFREISVEGLS